MKYEIDTSILPHAYLHWTTTKGEFYIDCATNEKFNERPDVVFSWKNKNAILRESGSVPLYAYAKYHADIDRLEIAGMTFDTRRTAGSHEWKPAGGRYFINKAKKVFDENGNPVISNYDLDKNHYAYDFKSFLQQFHRLHATDEVMKEFHKFLGKTYFTNGSGRAIEAQWTWHIHEWYIRKQRGPVSSKGKQQLLTDKLTAIPLSDISDLTKKYPAISTNTNGYGYRNCISNVLYFERVDDEWSVVRVLHRYGREENEYFKERERMYISDKGVNRIVTPTDNGWIPTKQLNDWANHYFANKDEASEKCKRLKYIMPIFEDDMKIKRMLFNVLRFPEIEQLAKMGYANEAMKIASSYTPKAVIKEKFGYYNEKEKNLLKKVGLTKHQLDKHLSAPKSRNNYYYHTTGTLLEYMREFFGDDFAHLDNATFDRYYDGFNAIFSRWGRHYFETYMERINVDKKKFIKNMVRIGEKNEQTYGLISDTISAYLGLEFGTAPEIDWFFDSYSDVVRAHDAFTEMRRLQDAERRARYNQADAERMKKEEEKRIKVDEKRKEFEYEDDNFIIRLPKDGKEITTEGIAQHICIGGYVGRHSNGETNLFFLRKKSAPDIPFYAIEMTNAKTINQIHGFGNKWLGNDPEAIPTVVRWLRNNRIKCDEKILTCTATGYGCHGANYIHMPVVD